MLVEGIAEPITAPPDLDVVLALENAKYSTDYGIEMMDPALNSCFRVRPRWVFGFQAGDFTGLRHGGISRQEFAARGRAL